MADEYPERNQSIKPATARNGSIAPQLGALEERCRIAPQVIEAWAHGDETLNDKKAFAAAPIQYGRRTKGAVA